MSSIGPSKGWEELLIYQVQERDFIWFPEDDDYKNPWKRSVAWKEIGKILKQDRTL